MRRICYLLISVMIFAFVSCGQSNNDEKLSNVFCSEDIVLPEDFSPNRIFGVRNGYALLEVDNSLDKTRVVKVMKDGDKYSVTSDMTINDYVRCAAFLPDGDIIYVSQNSVCRRGEDNITVDESELSGHGKITHLATDGEGNIILGTQFSVSVCDENLVKQYSIDISGDLNGIYSSVDGMAYVWTSVRGSGMSYQSIDTENKCLGAAVDLPEDIDISVMNFKAGGEGGAWFDNMTGLYLVSNGSATLVCDYLNSDLASTKIMNVIPEDTDYIVMLYDGRLLMLERVPENKIKSKKLIRVAGKYIPNYLIEGAAEFNRTNPDHRIVITNYSALRGDADDLMRDDIISGKLPDIVIFSGYSQRWHEEYINQKLFCDLWEMIDADGDFDKSDLITDVLRAGERDGKLYEFVTSYTLSVLAMKTSNAPSDGWTLREYLDYAKSLDGAVIEKTGQENLLYRMLCCSEEEFVDIGEGRCDFDSALFREVLEFAKNCRTDVRDFLDDDELEIYDTDEKYIYANDKVMTAAINSDLPDRIYRDMWNKFRCFDTSLTGSPDTDGNGVILSPVTSFAIVDKSEVKPAAWEFIKSMLAYISIDNWGEFSCSRTVMNRIYDDLMKRVYTLDADTGKVRWMYADDIENSDFDSERDLSYIITEADRDRMFELLDGAGTFMRIDSMLWSIISEDAEAYFAGVKTLDETVKMIQDRAGTYIAEKN